MIDLPMAAPIDAPPIPVEGGETPPGTVLNFAEILAFVSNESIAPQPTSNPITPDGSPQSDSPTSEPPVVTFAEVEDEQTITSPTSLQEQADQGDGSKPILEERTGSPVSPAGRPVDRLDSTTPDGVAYESLPIPTSSKIVNTEPSSKHQIPANVEQPVFPHPAGDFSTRSDVNPVQPAPLPAQQNREAIETAPGPQDHSAPPSGRRAISEVLAPTPANPAVTVPDSAFTALASGNDQVTAPTSPAPPAPPTTEISFGPIAPELAPARGSVAAAINSEPLIFEKAAPHMPLLGSTQVASGVEPPSDPEVPAFAPRIEPTAPAEVVGEATFETRPVVEQTRPEPPALIRRIDRWLATRPTTPNTLVLEFGENGDFRVSVALRSAGLQVTISGATTQDVPWIQQLSSALESRGLDAEVSSDAGSRQRKDDTHEEAELPRWAVPQNSPKPTQDDGLRL